MTKFNIKGKYKTIEAFCWKEVEPYQEGKDRIVDYFRHPDISGNKICMGCLNPYHVHGWIDQGENGITVCPGNYVITLENGKHEVITPCALDMFFDTKDN